MIRDPEGWQLLEHCPLNRLYAGIHDKHVEGSIQAVHYTGHLVHTFLVLL